MSRDLNVNSERLDVNRLECIAVLRKSENRSVTKMHVAGEPPGFKAAASFRGAASSSSCGAVPTSLFSFFQLLMQAASLAGYPRSVEISSSSSKAGMAGAACRMRASDVIVHRGGEPRQDDGNR
jgi:hypothetical protein